MFHFVHTLHPQGDATLVTWTTRVEMPGWFAKAMGWLFAGMFKSATAKDLAALKAWVEKAAGGADANANASANANANAK